MAKNQVSSAKSLKATKTSTTSKTTSEGQIATPEWPSITPVVPATDLSINTLLNDQVLTIPRLWTTSLCKRYVDFLRTLPLTTTPGKPKKGEAVRVNDRYQINDDHFAKRLWLETALRELVEHPVIDGKDLSETETRSLWGGEVVGLNSNIRVYRYCTGQYFDQHYDDSNLIDTFPVPAKTTWTLLIYLTSPATGCVGGETVFYPEPATKREPAPAPIVAELEVGMALLHRHGSECLLHEGREVTAGEKWVIRSDLCVKR